ALRHSLVRPEEAAALPDDAVYFTFAGHEAKILRLDWSPDGTRLSSYDEVGRLKVWDVTRGKQLASLPVEPRGLGLDGRPDAWGPGGRLALCDPGGAVRLLEADTGRVRDCLPACAPLDPKAPGPPLYRQAAWSPDGTRLAATDPAGEVLIHGAA